MDVNVYLATGPHFCSFLLRVIIENHVISFSSHTFDQKLKVLIRGDSCLKSLWQAYGDDQKCS